MKSLLESIQTVLTPVAPEQIDEAKKLIKSHSSEDGVHVAKVYKHTGEDDDGDPYHVRLFSHGKENKDAEYFTNDVEDAHGTAQDMVKRASSIKEDISGFWKNPKPATQQKTSKGTYGTSYDADKDGEEKPADSTSGKHDASGLADVMGLKAKDEWKPLTMAQRKSMTPTQIRAHMAAQPKGHVTPRVHKMQDDGIDESRKEIEGLSDEDLKKKTAEHRKHMEGHDSRDDEFGAMSRRMTAYSEELRKRGLKEDIHEGVDGQYHPSNPKIDLYHDGKYHSSTNWSSTVKHAVARAKEKYPDMKGTWKGYKSVKEDTEIDDFSNELNEEFITERYSANAHMDAESEITGLPKGHPVRVAYEQGTDDQKRKMRCAHIYIKKHADNEEKAAHIERRKVQFHNIVRQHHGFDKVKKNADLTNDKFTKRLMKWNDKTQAQNIKEEMEMMFSEMAIDAKKASNGKFIIHWGGSKNAAKGKYVSDYHPAHKNFSDLTMRPLQEWMEDCKVYKDDFVIEAIVEQIEEGVWNDIKPQNGETWKDVAKDMFGFTAKDAVDGVKTVGQVAKKTLKMIRHPVQSANDAADKRAAKKQ